MRIVPPDNGSSTDEFGNPIGPAYQPASQVLSAAQIAGYAQGVGLNGDALATAVAIALAESGGDTLALGDVSLETATWGPSVGLWQIRSLYGDNGTGRSRDQSKLTDPAFNARSMYEISSGGTNWRPWSVYTNGAYRRSLTTARSAAAAPVAATGAGAPAGSVSATPAVAPVAFLAPSQRSAPIRIGGRAGMGELGNALIGGQLSMKIDEVSELTLLFDDQQHRWLNQQWLDIDTPVDFLGIDWLIVGIGTAEQDGLPALQVTCQPESSVALRQTTPATLQNLTRGDYLQRVCSGLPGVRSVSVQPGGAVQGTIGPTTVQDPSAPGGQRGQSLWELQKDLATKDGRQFVDAGGHLLYGDPTWLNTQGTNWLIDYNGSASISGGEHLRAMTVPKCTGDRRKPSPGLFKDDGQGYLTSEVDVTVDTPARGFPAVGNGMFLAGIPRFWRTRHTIASVTMDLAQLPYPQVQITAKRYPLILPSDSVDISKITILPGHLVHGTRNNLDFVSFCLAQVGDAYVWGAGRNVDDPDPHAFDCSGLVYWAAYQVGVVTGQTDQQIIDQCRRAGTLISVAEASRTRGAVLQFPGHIVVSLGDGRTVEARGKAYGVMTYVVANRGFTTGARLPGMIYT